MRRFSGNVFFPGFLLSSCFLGFFFLTISASAFADGGAVLSQQMSGPYRITLFGSPAPLRAGPTDLSVMIQDTKTGEPVLNQSVAVKIQATGNPNSETWVPPCCSMKVHDDIVPATHDNAQNKLLYAVNVILPASGPHDIFVRIGGEDGEIIQHSIDVHPPLAPGSSYWTYLAFPPLLISLFVLNQRLRRRNQR